MTYLENLKLTFNAEFTLVHVLTVLGFSNIRIDITIAVCIIALVLFYDYLSLIDAAFSNYHLNGKNGFSQFKQLVEVNCNEV